MRITKPRTQRKRLFQASAHVRRKHFSAALSPDLKKKHGANAFPVKAGDTVRVMRGDRQGFEGKITRVDRPGFRVFVEGVTREKVDGTSIQIPLHPSKVMITNLDLDDKWRREALERKGAIAERAAPPAEVAEEETRRAVEEKPEVTPKRAKKPRAKRRRKKPAGDTAPEKAKKTQKTAKPKRKRTQKAKAATGAA